MRVLNKLIILGLFSMLTIISNNIFAQNVADTIYGKEVVITAAKTLQSTGNVTQKINVITAAEIENMIIHNRNIAEALKMQAGASISALSRNDANWGTYSGIGSKYSTYMIDGLPIDAYIDPMTLDLMAIDHIEYQRGPASIMYPNYLSQDFAGNQTPLAGTVNLILKERVTNPTTCFLTSFGSYNTFNTQVFHQNSTNNIHYFAGVNYEMSDYTDYGIEGSWLNMKKNPEYKKTKIFGRTSWISDDDKQKLTLFVNKTLHNGDAGRVYRGFDHDYGIMNAGYQMKLDETTDIRANVGYRSYDRKWQESNFTTIDSLVSNNGMRQNIVPADISVTKKHGKEHLLTTGVDYQGAEYYTWSDPLVGYKTYGNKSTAMQTGVYAQEELHFGKLIIRGGARFNYIKTNIALINGEMPAQAMKEWTKPLYSGGIKYNINNTISVFANAGTSFMTPGLKSTGGTILADDTVNSGQKPNPDLKPESGIGFDGGLNLRLASNIKLSLRGFYISVQDAIIDNVVRQSPSQTMSVNAGKTSSTGLEFEISQQINTLSYWFANFTYNTTTIENPFDADQDGAQVPFAPGMIINGGISYTTPFGLTVTPLINYTDGYFDSSSKSGRAEFKPGLLLNATASMEIYKNGNNKISCFAQFYNITNNKYEMPWQFMDTGFATTIGIKASF
jgi:outer membrane receptor protein involved in Fe transport